MGATTRHEPRHARSPCHFGPARRAPQPYGRSSPGDKTVALTVRRKGPKTTARRPARRNSPDTLLLPDPAAAQDAPSSHNRLPRLVRSGSGLAAPDPASQRGIWPEAERGSAGMTRRIGSRPLESFPTSPWKRFWENCDSRLPGRDEAHSSERPRPSVQTPSMMSQPYHGVGARSSPGQR